MERTKLEIELNKKVKIRLLFNDCVEGTSKYGKYYLYAVEDTETQTEYSLFASDNLHEQLKQYSKDDVLEVSKTAIQKGNKLAFNYEVKALSVTTTSPKPEIENIDLYRAMEISFDEAIKLQQKFNGMANVNQIAITLFIQRTKTSNNTSYLYNWG